MANLAALGVTVRRRFVSGSGAETKPESAERTELEFTLPKSTEVQATFGAEGLGAKVFKIFKREIQTGDGLFDEAVLIKTETADATAGLLESTHMRTVIERIVSSGGALEIDGAAVKVNMPGSHEVDDELTMHLVTALVTPAG